MNVKFLVSPEQKDLQDLILMLEIARNCESFGMSTTEYNPDLQQDYCQRYIELRSHLMAIRRFRVAQESDCRITSEELLTRFYFFDKLLFTL